ncbi:GlsB/YeaQ/YmgE family stress response membrane protein [Actinokineospora xionganensis]|uniref:GlsB/YeaQ/YmgE family stress response membrane protein n=1 Tax=Actinokineospora xionganensis TaxID=2684470 RepID=A0ABR7L0B8_9PSEU|nr:GlsB/YeaQ/YmgE family stress response membrane protein [Actinokineospora xionganensis]MBC6445792.1 GlsB/YeaQ/YmgE family stress response membrane protein [Actinokineospora xionganensis]
MTVTGFITAIIIGLVIGVIARMILPGKQNIPIWLTIVVGIIAALLGTALARAIGIPTTTSGVDWMELLVQVLVAMAGVALISQAYGRRRGLRR